MLGRVVFSMCMGFPVAKCGRRKTVFSRRQDVAPTHSGQCVLFIFFVLPSATLRMRLILCGKKTSDTVSAVHPYRSVGNGTSPFVRPLLLMLSVD